MKLYNFLNFIWFDHFRKWFLDLDLFICICKEFSVAAPWTKQITRTLMMFYCFGSVLLHSLANYGRHFVYFCAFNFFGCNFLVLCTTINTPILSAPHQWATQVNICTVKFVIALRKVWKVYYFKKLGKIWELTCVFMCVWVILMTVQLGTILAQPLDVIAFCLAHCVKISSFQTVLILKINFNRANEKGGRAVSAQMFRFLKSCSLRKNVFLRLTF